MSKEEVNGFETAWVHFEASLRSKLAAKMQKQEIAVNFANLILRDAANVWFSAYGIESKWLAEYTAGNPEKAEAVKNILRPQMKFGNTETGTQVPDVLKVAVPAAGGLAGIGIAKVLKTGLFTQCVALAAPAALLYFGVKEYEKSVAEKGQKSSLEGYIAQLQPYKQQIIQIIES